jgi:hypothetical protein
MTRPWSSTLQLPTGELFELAREALANTQTEWGASRWGEYRRCRRAHALRYHLHIAPTRKDPTDLDEDDDRDDTGYFDVGRLVHAGHRFVREGAMAGESKPRDWRNVLAVAAETHEVEHVYEAERLLSVYYGLRGPENAGFPEGAKILAVEQHFEAPAGSPIAPYTARADAIVRMPSGEILVVDDKTRGQALPKDREKFARGQATNPQFLGLSWLVREAMSLSEPPSLWLHALIKTKVAKFDALVIPFTPHALTLWQNAQAQDARKGCTDNAPNYNSCAPGVGSRCWAFTWCHGSDEERARHFTQRKGER